MEHPARSFTWTATVADDSEMVSEDPLGLDYIAQQVGLRLLPTLTTRSTRAQAFAMVLYGLRLADQAIHEFGLSPTDEVRRELFERWERFWALATMESRNGEVRRGDWDAMRGIRGAQRAWKPGEGPLSLTYSLISRQQELGNLGAYFSPLRRARLVDIGSVKPSPAALGIVDAFWDEVDENKHRSRYEDYALAALEPSRTKIERKRTVTLERVGERSRLTSLITEKRSAQQKRLHDALFSASKDPTSHSVCALIEAAAHAGVRNAKAVLEGVIAGAFGNVDHGLHDLFQTALAYGNCMQAAVGAFDRAYSTIYDAGWIAGREAITKGTFSVTELEELRSACGRLLDAPAVAEIQKLPMHGRPFLRLCDDLRTANASTAVEDLLGYHLNVQTDRRRGDGWIRAQGDNLVLSLTSYAARPSAPRFPTFKIPAVQTLLVDMGRLPFGETPLVPEAAA
jgi:hypothetical protein